MASIDLAVNQVIVMVVSKTGYETGIEHATSLVSKKYGEICYISLNKPYTTLGEIFSRKGIDVKKIIFIDCVTGRAAKENGYNVITVSSPKALTQLSIAITEEIGKSAGAFIFDSLSTLLAYQDNSTSIKFVHSIVSKMRTTKKRCVFICLTDDLKTDLMKDVSMFVDKIISVR